MQTQHNLALLTLPQSHLANGVAMKEVLLTASEDASLRGKLLSASTSAKSYASAPHRNRHPESNLTLRFTEIKPQN